MNEETQLNFDDFEIEDLVKFIKRVKRKIKKIERQKLIYTRKVIEVHARSVGMSATELIKETNKDIQENMTPQKRKLL